LIEHAEIIRRDAQILDPDGPGAVGEMINVLMGLRYDEQFVAKALKGVSAMKESVTCQAIVREGRAEGKRKAKPMEFARCCCGSAQSAWGGPTRR
jgi:hypothetical protein